MSPTATISNLHLYARGTAAIRPRCSLTQFLHQLQPFSAIRFMDWMGTIGSTVSTWQQRTPPTSFLSTGPAGVPYEDMIELANETQKDMWINIPALATPNYVQHLAQLIDADLDPNLNVYLEYANETWAPGTLAVHPNSSSRTSSDHLVTATNAEDQVEQQTAYEPQRTD